MSFEVRPARADEATAIVPLYEWLFAPPGSLPPDWDPAAAEKRLRTAIGAAKSTILVAADGERLIGICSAYIDLESVRYGLRCWIEDLAVDPDRRSEGVGVALLDAAREWAASHGASHLELDSGDARPDAHRFYEREDPTWTSRQFAWLVNG